jgi:hypothetical protein
MSSSGTGGVPPCTFNQISAPNPSCPRTSKRFLSKLLTELEKSYSFTINIVHT